MLGSITPLGERGRGSRWWLTVGAFMAASTLAGGLLGAILGAIGSLVGLEGSQAALWLLAAALIAGLVLDLGVGGLRPPSVTRQVDDRWLYRYRGWVTGVGFGVQLGLGMVTIVTTAFTYVTFFAAMLSGAALTGLVIGGTYGAVRAATILGGSSVDSPERLMRMHELLRRWERPARRASVALQGTLAATALVLTLGQV
jgi:MFS family permease